MSTMYGIAITLSKAVDQPSKSIQMLLTQEWQPLRLSEQHIGYMLYDIPEDFTVVEDDQRSFEEITAMLDHEFVNKKYVGFMLIKEDMVVDLIFYQGEPLIQVIPSSGGYWKAPNGFIDLNRYIDEFLWVITAAYSDYSSIELSILR